MLLGSRACAAHARSHATHSPCNTQGLRCSSLMLPSLTAQAGPGGGALLRAAGRALARCQRLRARAGARPVRGRRRGGPAGVLRPARARLRGLPGRGRGLRHGAPARALSPSQSEFECESECLMRARGHTAGALQLLMFFLGDVKCRGRCMSVCSCLRARPCTAACRPVAAGSSKPCLCPASEGAGDPGTPARSPATASPPCALTTPACTPRSARPAGASRCSTCARRGRCLSRTTCTARRSWMSSSMRPTARPAVRARGASP